MKRGWIGGFLICNISGPSPHGPQVCYIIIFSLFGLAYWTNLLIGSTYILFCVILLFPSLFGDFLMSLFLGPFPLLTLIFFSLNYGHPLNTVLCFVTSKNCCWTHVWYTFMWTVWITLLWVVTGDVTQAHFHFPLSSPPLLSVTPAQPCPFMVQPCTIWPRDWGGCSPRGHCWLVIYYMPPLLTHPMCSPHYLHCAVSPMFPLVLPLTHCILNLSLRKYLLPTREVLTSHLYLRCSRWMVEP